jgi:hypothetical protein
MRRIVVALSLAVLALAGWLTPHALAQNAKASGTVTAVTAKSITVMSSGKRLTFVVDPSTDVIVLGGSTSSTLKESTGKPGASVAASIKVGNPVEITYYEKGSARHAAVIRRIDATAALREKSTANKPASSSGTVEAVSASSLTISGSAAGDATFKQTFNIDSNTKVIAVGAGTAAAASGGKIRITEVVARGDRVNVSYLAKGNSLLAAEIRVTAKANK